MDTLLVDREDWEELVQAATRAKACLGVLEKLRAGKLLVLTPPESVGAEEAAAFVREFDVMLSSNRERLEEALLSYEEEDGDEPPSDA